jgi:hypothetical protein
MASQEEIPLASSPEVEFFLDMVSALRDDLLARDRTVADVHEALKECVFHLKHSHEFIFKLSRMWSSFILTPPGETIMPRSSLQLLPLVSEELRDDHDIVFHAVRANWKEFEFASERLRRESLILRAAVSQEVCFVCIDLI